MEYIIVKNNIVTELISASSEPESHWIPVDIDGGICVGSDIRMYDECWQRRKLIDLFNDGFITLKIADNKSRYKAGTVLEKIDESINEIVQKTDYELVTEGARELDAFEYIDDDSETIITAQTVDELFNVGKITAAERDEYRAQQIRSQRDIQLQELDEIVMNPLRWNAFSAVQQSELAEYRLALLDVPQQTSFPNSVIWPDMPELN